MATDYIVNGSYISYSLVGAVKRMSELSDTLKTIDNDDRDYMTYLCGELYDLDYYIEEYASIYTSYITRHQLIKICKYKSILNNLKKKIQQFDLFDKPEYEFNLLSYFDNKDKRDIIIGKMQYYLDEYNKYVNSIGLQLNDLRQDELIYELLNT
jgi:hypothetical protein